ncbi:dipeptide/tripeptide permease, partial [Vibrio parahaemolyticus]|nr:dipeptide/tripeptide permease [Vibrio parahaemolyticus]
SLLLQCSQSKVTLNIIWIVRSYYLHNLGELSRSPSGLSLVTKLAPLRLGSLMMGSWFGFNAIGNYVAGYFFYHVGELGAM